MIDSPEFARGRNGERLVAAVLMDRGWFVIPSYDFSGSEGDKAPKMRRHGEGYVIPDLDTAKDGKRIWVEVKTKARPDPYRAAGNRLEHGITRRHWDDYQRIQKETGCPVYLVIYEECSQDVLTQSIDRLAASARYYDGTKMGRTGMVFFPRTTFRRLVTVQPEQVAV